MLLRDLPEDILAIVLSRCVGTSKTPAQGLKRSLPLLAVCRQWRRLASPSVYSHVFVQYGDLSKHRNGPLTGDSDLAEVTDVAVKTNLDLIAMTGCARKVRRVQIDVYCLVNPFPGWREVIQRMRAVASKWRVVELKATTTPDYRRSGGRSVDLAKYTDDIAEIGDALTALMPDVCRLECNGSNKNPLAQSLYGHLASHYADQLRLFESSHPITLPPDFQFMRLKVARMSYDKVADSQLPQMASGELVGLSLLNVPANHTWASFSADSDSRVIEFTKLKRLYVVYNASYQENEVTARHRDGHPWELYFPRLKHLDIHCTTGICPLLEYAVLPPRMESIYIRARAATFQDIANLVLPATKRLSLVLPMLSRGGPSVFPLINGILESARGSETLLLNIMDYELQVAPESITCTALTHLQISAPTSVDTMLAIIARLPNLIKLTFYDIDLRDIRADLSVPEADEEVDVEPLHSSLEGLAVNHDSDRHSPDTAVALVKYLLLKIPTLARLLAAQTPMAPVLEFVQAYAPRHPHLSAVSLELDEGKGSETTKWAV